MNQNLITEDLKAILKRNGWQIEGNNVHNLPGLEIVTAGPGAWGTVYGQQVRFIGTGFVALQRIVTPRPGTTFLDFTFEPLAGMKTEAELVAWLQANGRQSEGGQPAGYMNVWD